MTPAIGVGVMFNRVISGFLSAHPDAVDFVEVIPETLWTDRRTIEEPRYEPVVAAIDEVVAVAATYPLAAHGVGLSIGSASPLDERHLCEIRDFLDHFDIIRYSEHLAFNRVPGQRAIDPHMGVGLPLPCDFEVLEWLIPRVRRVSEITGRAPLLENGVRHTPYHDEDMSEPEFLNRLALATGCGVLLDLHNLYTDFRNNGEPPESYLSSLDLSIVREIHTAGGSTIGTTYTDSHAGACPNEVWDLLSDVAPDCSNLEAVTFEFHDSYYPRLGELGLMEELTRAREIVACCVA